MSIHLKKYGRKRLLIVHELADLTDQPRFLLTDALHWESKRLIETWSYRLSIEDFHEFCKQVTVLITCQVVLLTSFFSSHALGMVSSNLPKEANRKFAYRSFNSKGKGGLVTQQPDPNQERFLQQVPEPLPIDPNQTEQVIPTPETEHPSISPQVESSEVKIPVTQIKVTGSTIFGQEDFNPITEPLQGREVSLEELKEATKEITQLYLNAGYITSRAVLVDQKIIDGVVRIQVLEGNLIQIEIEGIKRLNHSYIRQRIEQGVTTPLRVEELEEQLRLLRTDPLLENIEASLRSGEKIGESILVVKVTEANPFYGNLNFDNFSPPSVGSERFGALLGYRNLTGIGDNLFAAYDRSTTGGSEVAEFGYQVPLNAKNGTLQLRAVIDRNQVTQAPFDELNIEGESELYELSLRQPLVRNPREELALSLGFSFRDGQTFLNFNPSGFGIGPDEDGVSRISVLRLGQDYLKRDLGGAWVLRSQFSIGTGLFDATTNESPIPDSRFFSWLGQVQRVQRLSDDQLLVARVDLQLSPDSLLSSEQFVIGGGQSLRGFRQNVRSGDSGFRFTIEDRITLARNQNGASVVQVAPFFDMGAVWNDSDNPNRLKGDTFLAGLGLGLILNPSPRLNLRVDFTIPLLDIDDRGENAQDDGIFFSVNYGL